MADFDRAFAQAIEIEGGYTLTNHANDNGKMTYAGISRRAWPKWEGWALIDAGRPVPNALVRTFYLGNFWLRFRCDQINDQDVAECVFLGAINAEASIRVLQIVVGVTPDGVVGPQTLAAVNAAEPDRLIDRLTLAKIARYIEITDRDAKQREWFRGWVKRAFKEAIRG